MRVALAALLFSEPDLLLLDEPTNHLDLEAAMWLESYLVAYPGTVILVSHDRGLLNRVPTKILHLEGQRLLLYNGNYDTFERTRRERLEREAASNAKIQAQRRHIQAFVDRFRYKASKARQAQSRLKMLEKLQPIASVVESQTISFDFPEPEQLSPPIVSMEGCAGAPWPTNTASISACRSMASDSAWRNSLLLNSSCFTSSEWLRLSWKTITFAAVSFSV